MDKNLVFFGESGLTSTSANHVANLAKEYAQSIESELQCIKFYDTYVGLIGTEGKQKTSVGFPVSKLAEIPGMLKKVTSAKSLIAWLREAIKAREALLNAINKKDIEEWYGERGLEFFHSPKEPEMLDKEDIVAEMNIKERNHIYTLETKCAVIGKLIHPDGSLSKARKALLKVESAPFEVQGDGRDALVIEYRQNVASPTVDELFFSLQKEHRETQAELNKILHEVDEKVREANMKLRAEYAEELRKWDSENKKLLNEFNEWKSEEAKKVADLKIVIPDHLKGIYEEVNGLGK